MRFALVAVALLSPLLTLLRLMQMKEWRFDRFGEHLRKEGFMQQLIGRSRLTIVGAWCVASLFIVVFSKEKIVVETISMLLIVLLATAASVQIGSGKQRMPVWTAKAVLVTAASLLLATAAAVAAGLSSHPVSPLLLAVMPLVAPLFAFGGWCMVFPLDRIMKVRTLAVAERIRLAHPHITVIGITGSVGKTTMKELLAHLLKPKNALSTPAHVNSEIGVARWLSTTLAKEPADSTRILIVEMGAYRVGEIALLCRIARPTIGIITYVGTQHLSLFGSRENIIQAKGELFEALPKNGTAFANADNDACDALKKRASCPVRTVGTGHADIQAFDIEELPDGNTFTAFGLPFQSALPGTHSVTGSLLAIAVAKTMGIAPEESQKNLRTFRSLQKTFEVKTVGGVTVLDDTYNSSPDSVSAAIEWAMGRPEQKKILIMEGIIELGEEEETMHRILAKEAAKVFSHVFLAHSRYLPYFTDAFGDRAKEAATGGAVTKDTLVVLCGRLSPAVIRRFLPTFS